MFNKNIGRNDLCWCGSQKKYKKCHLNRDKQKPLEPWLASKELNQKFSKPICSSPNSYHQYCSKKIIKAHTIPKSSSLKAIAKDGHVLGLDATLNSIRNNKGKLQLKKIGLNHASTFNGFCTTHDDKLFAPLEKKPFLDTAEQCFLLSYRSFARELYNKTAALDATSLLRQSDRGACLRTQMEIQMQSFLTEQGTQSALTDLHKHKEFYDKSLENNDYTHVKAVIFTFKSAPPVMVSGSVYPDYDFNGNMIQDLMLLDKRTDMISVSSFYDGNFGKIVFSWLDHCHEACNKLIDSLLKKERDDIPTLLIQYIVKNFENFFISPEWWDSVSESNRENLLSLAQDTINIYASPSSHGLTEKIINIPLEPLVNINFINFD